jgi:hypothetical protein
LTLNYVGRDEELLLRAIEYEVTPEIKSDLNKEYLLEGKNSVTGFDYFETNPEKVQDVDILANIESVIGIVDDNSNIEKLQFEVFKENEIETGSIVEVEINEKKVLYKFWMALLMKTRFFNGINMGTLELKHQRLVFGMKNLKNLNQ